MPVAWRLLLVISAALFFAGSVCAQKAPAADRQQSAVPKERSLGVPAAQDPEHYGFDDGLASGRRDKARGKSYRPTDNDLYREADHGWNDGAGDREQYKRLYRQAYINGYEEGYNESSVR